MSRWDLDIYNNEWYSETTSSSDVNLNNDWNFYFKNQPETSIFTYTSTSDYMPPLEHDEYTGTWYRPIRINYQNYGENINKWTCIPIHTGEYNYEKVTGPGRCPHNKANQIVLAKKK